MKSILLTIITLILWQATNAQTITGIDVRPVSSSSINVYTHVDLWYVEHINARQITVANDTILIKICTEPGMLPAVVHVTDTATVVIDPLLTHYFLSVKGYYGNDTNSNCNYAKIYDSAFHEFNTPVTDSTHFLSVAELSPKDDVVVYPNPIHDQLTISGSCTSCHQVYIVNALGQKVYQGPYGHASEIIDLSALVNGIYLLYIEDKTGKFVSSQKVVKQ